MEVSLDWIAILIATAVAMAVGAIWYGPLFGNRWLKLVGLKKKDTEQNWQKPMMAMLIMALVQAIVLTYLITFASSFYNQLDTGLGMLVGFIVWLGLVVPTIVGNNMFARRNNELNYIEAGNSLVTLVLMGAVIGAML